MGRVRDTRVARVLMVCAANVCRSPVMALSFAAAAERAGLAVEVDSAGRIATAGDAVCPVAADALAGLTGAAWELAAHRSQRLSAGLIESATLILGATREERAAVATLSPRSRARVFTLPEAVALGTVARERGKINSAASVEGFLDVLEAHRGALVVPAPPQRRLWRRPRANPLDLSDGHGAQHRVHAARVAEGRRLAEQLVELIVPDRGGLQSPSLGRSLN